MKIEGKLDGQMVEAFRGEIDFYYWKGQPVARQWPRPPKQPNTQAQLTARARMATASAWAKEQPQSWLDAWLTSPQMPGRSYRDRYISEAIKAQAYCTLPPMPQITKAILVHPSEETPAHLRLELADGYTPLYSQLSCMIRAQPPDSPPYTYYDAGWYTSRCVAVYKLYQPVMQGFQRIYISPSLEEPAVWRCYLNAMPDAVSWYLTPIEEPTDPDQYPAMLYAATIARPI